MVLILGYIRRHRKAPYALGIEIHSLINNYPSNLFALNYVAAKRKGSAVNWYLPQSNSIFFISTH